MRDFDIRDNILYAYNGIETKVVIPAEVEAIELEAFNNNTNIEEISLEAGSKLEWIGARAFKDCTRLTDVNLSNTKTLHKIAVMAFSGCKSLRRFFFSEDTDGKAVDIGMYAFAHTGLLKIIIPDGCTRLRDFTFKGCKDLLSITFGPDMNFIHPTAFEYCSGLLGVKFASDSQIKLLNNVKATFDDCSDLLFFTFETFGLYKNKYGKWQKGKVEDGKFIDAKLD